MKFEEDMTEDDLIKKVLNLKRNPDGSISTLTIAIRGARQLSGRNTDTGEIIPKIDLENFKKQTLGGTYESNKFMSVAMYLIIIDLIGNIFKRKGGKEQKNQRFKQALEHFSELNSNQIDSLKALRNSLAHKFSLGNESEIFTLDFSKESEDIIVPPEERYVSKNRNNKSKDENVSTAYYENICDLVENIYGELHNSSKKNQLEIVAKYKENIKLKIHDFNSMYFVNNNADK